MTVSEILEQAKALTAEEREALIDQLMAMRAIGTRSEDSEWSDEELENLLEVKPMTGAEIVAAGITGGWANMHIPDGATWIAELRRRRRGRHQW